MRERWAESVGTRTLPAFRDMISFLEHRSLIENTECVQQVKETQKSHHSNNKYTHSRAQGRPQQTCLATSNDPRSGKPQPSCMFCKRTHPIYACEQFRNLTTQERYDFVKKVSICHNCLLTTHKTIDCRRGPCRKCQKRHNTLLHFDQPIPAEKEVNSQASTSQCISTLGSYNTDSQGQVILGTAMVEILASKGQYRPCRAFLDSCSQCNSITEKLANDIGLPKKEINTKLKGVENIESRIKYITSTKIKSRYNEVDLNLSFLVFKEISGLMPTIPINKNALRIPNDIFLADPAFHRPSAIDILIGSEYFYHLMREGKIRVKGQSAIFQETDFGWIFAGRYVSPQSPKSALETPSEISCNLIKFHDLPLLWELGEGASTKPRSDEEKAAESHYVETTTRDESGRYIVRLPFNSKKETLGDSRNTAFQRFYALEKRFAKNSDLKAQYSDCIDGYFKEGHISLFDNQDISKPGYYLPHQAVIKADSLTTKVRVVFDGSTKTSTGVSLNDTFLVGPTIQEDLFSIVTRFRSFPYAMTADIEQMYRQVQVSAEDSFYQKILWRKNPNEPIKTYALKTVTFGTSCAPFLAIRTLHRVAEDERVNFPVASAILKRDFYVDDLLTGAHTLQEARQLRDDLIHMLHCGGFNLRKWASNCPDLCHEISDKSSEALFSLDPSETIKALGIHWDPRSDSILYTVKSRSSTNKATKRTILSEIAKLFDPLGLLGPVILIGNILIQKLWKLKLKWE